MLNIKYITIYKLNILFRMYFYKSYLKQFNNEKHNTKFLEYS